MKQAVKSFIGKHQLLHPNAVVVVGVSGGPDSLALLHFLWKYMSDLQLNLVVAHADHALRGQSSEEDYVFVQQFCNERQIVFEGATLDVLTIKKEKGLSIQMAAREARYTFFKDIMEKHCADYLALAQHGDDQVETMLMKQVRGTYSYGLAGIPVRRPFATGTIIRPFLGITKKEIEHYCKEEYLQPRIDESNASDKYVRNRFRKYVLPFLKEENPAVSVQFQSLSEWLTEDEDYLMEQAKEKLDQFLISMKQNESVVISVENIGNVPIPLQRRMIHLILTYLYGNISLNIRQVHIEQTISLFKSQAPNNRISLPDGAIAIRAYDQCSFSFKMKEFPQHFEQILPIPGMIELEIGKVSGEITKTLPKMKNPNIFVCDADCVSYPITVRSKKDGDVIRPIGLQGTKKVNRLFIDKKVERSLRTQWPIIEDREGDILWVPTLSNTEKGLVTKTSQNFLVLTFERTV